MFIFAHPHQGPYSTVLDSSELLKVLAGDPDEKCVTIVQPGGDKGVEFAYVSEMKECNVTEVRGMCIK